MINVASKIETTGTVVAYELIPVMSKASNLQITEVLVDEGDIVTQGQTLIRLDDSVLKAELKQAQALVQQAKARLAELKAGTREEELARAQESVKIAQADILQAEADLELAQAKLQRNRQLEAEGAIATDRLDEFVNDELVKKSNLQKNRARLREAQQRLLELQKGARKEVVAQAEASLAEAQARVKLIETRLQDTIVTAPVNGQVAQRNAKVGDVASVSSNQNLLTIIQDGRLELEVRIPESELRDIAPQQKVKISSTANPNLNLTGIVRDINPIIDRDSRQGIVNVDLPVNSGLKPGMFVQASIITTISPSLTIPMKAVIPENNGQGTVYVLQENNTVKAQQVSLGEIVDNEAIEILSGIQLGDIVALKGANYLQDGNAVDLVN
jgi:multidrug efflux pump subunit AcrA (membrane-fusion protein)